MKLQTYLLSTVPAKSITEANNRWTTMKLIYLGTLTNKTFLNTNFKPTESLYIDHSTKYFHYLEEVKFKQVNRDV